MNERKKYKLYAYTCDAHPLGEPVRRIGVQEVAALMDLSEIVAHADHCWVRGCQHEVTQARLVEASSGE